jgi:hypothetical protein
MASLKGQNLRVFNGTAVIAQATSCQITLNTTTYDTNSKDDVGMAAKPTVTSKNWQVQVDSLDVSDVGTFLTAIKNGTPFTLKWDETSTTDNTTPEEAAFGRTGQAYLTDASFVFNDREFSTKSLQFTGTGALSAL